MKENQIVYFVQIRILGKSLILIGAPSENILFFASLRYMGSFLTLVWIYLVIFLQYWNKFFFRVSDIFKGYNDIKKNFDNFLPLGNWR